MKSWYVAGNLFNYHADLITKDKAEKTGALKQEIKQEQLSPPAACQYVRVKEEDQTSSVDPSTIETEFSDLLADEIFEEAQELIQNSPWIFEPETLSCVMSTSSVGDELAKSKMMSWCQTTEAPRVSQDPTVVTEVGSVLRSVSDEKESPHYTSVIQRQQQSPDQNVSMVNLFK